MADAIPASAPDEIDETLPEIVKNFLRSGGELEEIRLDERGKWTHEGLDFENPRIIKLFSRSVARTEGGTWVLEVGRFTYPITVENTGFFVERVDFSNSPPTLTLSDQTEDTLDPATLEYEPTGKLFCAVKDGEFRARFKRPAYYQIAEHLRDRDGEAVFEIDGEDYPISDFEELM